MLHQPVPKSLPRFHCPLTSPIFNTHLRKSTTLPKQPHKHGREEGYGEDRATFSAPAGHAGFTKIPTLPCRGQGGAFHHRTFFCLLHFLSSSGHAKPTVALVAFSGG